MAIEGKISAVISLLNGTKTITTESIAPSITANEQMSSSFTVAIGAVDAPISLGPIASAKLIWFSSDQELTLKLNGSVIGITTKSLLMTGAAVTSITASNGSGVIANVTLIAVGD